MGLFMISDNLVGWFVWIVHTFFTSVFILIVISGVSGVPIGGLMSASEIEKLNAHKKSRQGFIIFDAYIFMTLLMFILVLLTGLGIINKMHIFTFWGIFFGIVLLDYIIRQVKHKN